MGCETNHLYGLPNAKECRTGNEENMLNGFVLATEDQQFDTPLAAALKSNWEADQAAGKLFVVPGVKRVENASKEAVIEEYESGDEEETRAARRGFMAYFNMVLDANKIARTYSDKFKKYYPFDEKGNIRATNPSGTIIKPLSISSIKVGNLPIGLSGAKPLTSIKIIEANSTEYDDDGHLIQPYKQGDAADRWFPTELVPVALVTVEQIGATAANAFVIEVKYKSTSETDANGDPVTSNGIEGLDVVNLEVRTALGVIVVPLTVAEVSGYTDRYTVTCTAFTAGSVRVKATSAILVESLALTLT